MARVSNLRILVLGLGLFATMVATATAQQPARSALAQAVGSEEVGKRAFPTVRVMTFNILQAGGEAANVGFNNSYFGGSRIDELAAIIRLAKADIVGVQEDCTSDELLRELGDQWHRVGSIYSRLPLFKVSVEPYLTVAKAELTEDHVSRTDTPLEHSQDSP